MKHLVRVLSILLVLAFLLTACAPAAQPAQETGEKKYTICFAFQDLETEFWMAGHKAITETLKAKGYNVVEVNSNEDANKQLEQVKNCIAQKVDGIMVIPVDGSIALKLIAEANKAGIPIGIFNRPPQSDEGNALTVVANNEKIAEATVEYMAQEAQKLGKKMKPLIMVGDLGDPNAVGRKQGFYNVIEKYPDLFETPVEVATKWNADVARDGLQAAMTANPDIDFLFTSSDFLYPTIQGVLEPLGKWTQIGDPNHVLMGGLDGDKTACSLMQAGNAYVDATGVQDLYYEADTLLAAIIKAVETGEKAPDAWLDDPGFALTQGNMAEREMDMWGCKLFHEAGGAPASKPSTDTTTTEPVTLRVMTWLDAEGSARFDVLAKAFEASHPGVTVKHEAVAGSGAAIYPDVLRTSIAAGDPPDVFYMWGGSIAGQYIDAGQVLPLNAYYDKFKWGDRFSSALIERVSRDGKIYGVPFSNLGMGFWYNKATLEKVGIDSPDKLPKTFAEMEEMCGKFKEQDIYCVSIGGKFGWHTMRVLDYFLEAKCGPEKHNALNALQESWDQQCVVDAYDTFQQWINKGWVVPDFLTTSPDDSRLPIFNGTAALVNEGIWYEGVLSDNEMASADYDFFIPPTDASPLRFSAFYEQLMIPSNAKNQDLAAEFINWYSSKETIEMNDESKALIGGFPANKDVKPDCTTRPLTCKWVDTLANAEGTYPPTDQAFYKELMDSFFEIQDKVVAGQLTPQEAAKLFQERADAWKMANPDKVSK